MLNNKCPPGTICLSSGLVLLIAIIIFLFYIVLKNNQSNSDKKVFEQKISDLKNDFLIQKINTNKKVDQIEQNNLNNNKQKNLDNPLFIVNKTYERANNPFLAPLRSDPKLPINSLNIQGLGVPINTPTRGYSSDYQQIGVLTGGDKILPLYGKPTWNGSSKWLYYTATDKFNMIKLPVRNRSKDCTQEYGCEQLDNKDKVEVPAYNQEFEVSIYNLDAPRYIPYVL